MTNFKGFAYNEGNLVNYYSLEKLLEVYFYKGFIMWNSNSDSISLKEPSTVQATHTISSKIYKWGRIDWELGLLYTPLYSKIDVSKDLLYSTETLYSNDLNGKEFEKE